MPVIKQMQPSDVLFPSDTKPLDFSPYKHKFLAQGDSWFSFGSLIPWSTSNMLDGLNLKSSACAVNCARPGKELVHMVDARQDPEFINLLIGKLAWPWDGLLLSAGGNDLISAIQTPTIDGNGAAVPPGLRLLLTAAERGTVTKADDYISPDGWALFSTHLSAQFQAFVAARDDAKSLSRGVPIFVHTYDLITPRNAGAGLNHGPWLMPALKAYAVPPTDWAPLTALFMQRLRDLLTGLALPGLQVAQTQGRLTPAAPGSTGSSNDWENEIHPNPGGYKKLDIVYGGAIDALLP